MQDCSLQHRLEWDQSKCWLYGIAGCPLMRGFEYKVYMEIQSRYSELSVISQVSAIEGCPLSGVPLYILEYTRIERADSGWQD